jgi:serine/threonine-protein kinase
MIGRTVGPYRVEEKLGEGGMGAVYRAVHATLEREVALKILPERLVGGSPEFVKRFLVEARAAARIAHPNIVQVHDAGEAGGAYFIAMEFVRGTDLRGLLARRGALPLPEALDLALQAAAGLGAAAKKGIIHRDVKPANLMLTADGVLKIADFGLAKNVEAATELTQSGQILGTPAYMSPEQADGARVDFRTDVYSLGVCLFEMAAGAKPFQADTPIALIKKHALDPVPDPAALNPALPAGFRDLVLRMMAKRPEDRFSSYDELSAVMIDLRRRIGTGAPQEAPRGAGAPAEAPATVPSGAYARPPAPAPAQDPSMSYRPPAPQGTTFSPVILLAVVGVVLVAVLAVAVLGVAGAAYYWSRGSPEFTPSPTEVRTGMEGTAEPVGDPGAQEAAVREVLGAFADVACAARPVSALDDLVDWEAAREEAVRRGDFGGGTAAEFAWHYKSMVASTASPDLAADVREELGRVVVRIEGDAASAFEPGEESDALLLRRIGGRWRIVSLPR